MASPLLATLKCQALRDDVCRSLPAADIMQMRCLAYGGASKVVSHCQGYGPGTAPRCRTVPPMVPAVLH